MINDVVGKYYGQDMPKSKNLFGVEVEVECERMDFPLINITPGVWRITLDGSLRGKSAREFLLNKPLPRLKTKNEVKNLLKGLEVYKEILVFSGRAGVHIHVDVRSMTFKDVWKFIIIYYILEGVILPENRKGNLFCLDLTSTEGIADILQQNIKDRYGDLNIPPNDCKYSALNVANVSRLGSLEFRALPFTLDADFINMYIDILWRIKESTKMFNDLVDIIEFFSGSGGYQFLTSILGKLSEEVTDKPFSEIERSLLNNMRLIQQVIY